MFLRSNEAGHGRAARVQCLVHCLELVRVRCKTSQLKTFAHKKTLKLIICPLPRQSWQHMKKNLQLLRNVEDGHERVARAQYPLDFLMTNGLQDTRGLSHQTARSSSGRLDPASSKKLR